MIVYSVCLRLNSFVNELYSTIKHTCRETSGNDVDKVM